MPTKKNGGSVASDSVTGLVTSESYANMNKNFTNNVSSGQCGGCRACQGGSVSCKKCSLKYKGGSAPAPAFDYTLPRNTKGGNIKSMHELMSQNSGHAYSLKHQSGGYKSPTDTGLNYNSSIKNASIPNGQTPKFNTNSVIVNQMLSTESVGAMPALNKLTLYGAMADNKTFNYYGQGAGLGSTLKDGFKNVAEKAKVLVEKTKKAFSSMEKKSTKKSSKKPTSSKSTPKSASPSAKKASSAKSASVERKKKSA